MVYSTSTPPSPTLTNHPTQGGSQLGTPSLNLNVPEGWLLDDKGESLRQLSIAPTDAIVVLLGIAIATIDLQVHGVVYRGDGRCGDGG